MGAPPHMALLPMGMTHLGGNYMDAESTQSISPPGTVQHHQAPGDQAITGVNQARGYYALGNLSLVNQKPGYQAPVNEALGNVTGHLIPGTSYRSQVSHPDTGHPAVMTSHQAPIIQPPRHHSTSHRAPGTNQFTRHQ